MFAFTLVQESSPSVAQADEAGGATPGFRSRRDGANALDLTAAINLFVDFKWVDHSVLGLGCIGFRGTQHRLQLSKIHILANDRNAVRVIRVSENSMTRTKISKQFFPIGSAFKPSVYIAHRVGNDHCCHRASPVLLEHRCPQRNKIAPMGRRTPAPQRSWCL